MSLVSLGIDNVWLFESPVRNDNRGIFYEWFKYNEISKTLGNEFSVKQGNVSVSNKGVIRGIHYSLVHGGQAKWVTCVSGHVLDFVVDIRPDSPTFKKYLKIDLKESNGRAVLIGAGLGHAFVSLEDNSIVTYLLDSVYSPEDEFEINPMDLELNIDWDLQLLGGAGVILSQKDAQAPSLVERFAEGKLPKISNR